MFYMEFKYSCSVRKFDYSLTFKHDTRNFVYLNL